MKTLSVIKTSYRAGNLSKAEYISAMYGIHSRLFEYPGLMKPTDIEKIEITDAGIIMTTRGSGCRFICPDKDKRVAPVEILNFDAYEPHELDLLMQFIRPGAVIFDIGANIGWYSVTIAARMPKTKIYAFEPIKQTYDYLKENIALNGLSNVKPYNFGFSDKKETLTFYYYPEGSGNASLANLAKSGHTVKLPCAVKKMDDFVWKQHCRVDVVKCDVEGAELSVFQGGIETIKRDKPVIFSEILRKWTKQFHYNPNEIIALLTGIGYGCFAVHGKKLQKFIRMDERTQETNFIFLHRQKHADRIAALFRRPI